MSNRSEKRTIAKTTERINMRFPIKFDDSKTSQKLLIAYTQKSKEISGNILTDVSKS